MQQFSGIEDYHKKRAPSLEQASIIEMKDLNKSEKHTHKLEEELKRERIRGDLRQKMVD